MKPRREETDCDEPEDGASYVFGRAILEREFERASSENEKLKQQISQLEETNRLIQDELESLYEDEIRRRSHEQD